jgi:hypothetical protein
MKPPPEEIARRLIYILYEAWTDVRSHPLDSQRLFELADAMHNAPALLTNFSERWLGYLREDLQGFYEKYPTSRNYIDFLDNGVPEDSQWLWLDLPDEPEPIA